MIGYRFLCDEYLLSYYIKRKLLRLIAVPIFPNRCVGANWENGRYKVLGSAVAALRNPHRRGEGVLAARIAGTIRTAGTTRRQRLVGTPHLRAGLRGTDRAHCVRAPA